MYLMNWILDENREPVYEPDTKKFSEWFGKADRVVAKDAVGDVLVSTVFLGINHQFGEGPPILFETLVFDGPLDGEMHRYSTWDEAVEGHRQMLVEVKRAEIKVVGDD